MRVSYSPCRDLLSSHSRHHSLLLLLRRRTRAAGSAGGCCRRLGRGCRQYTSTRTAAAISRKLAMMLSPSMAVDRCSTSILGDVCLCNVSNRYLHALYIRAQHHWAWLHAHMHAVSLHIAAPRHLPRAISPTSGTHKMVVGTHKMYLGPCLCHIL